MPASKFNKGRLSSMTNWSGGQPDTEGEEPSAFGEKLRQEMENAAAQLPIQEVGLELLQDNPFQYLARRSFDDDSMQELVDSIKSNGFYGALLARRKRGLPGRFELAYGHRRKEAARRAGLLTIPVKIVELDDQQMARIMASENFSRLDLDPIGEAAVVGLLADQQNLSARQISEIVGKKRGWVEARLTLHNAPAVLKQMVETRPDTFSHVPLLLRFRNDAAKLQNLTEEVLSQNLTLQQLRERLEEATAVKTSNEIDTNITNSNLPGNSDKNHNQNSPAISRYGKPLAKIDEETLIETELARLEKLVTQLSRHQPETLSWNIRSRLQRAAQTLKEMVGGD